MVHYVYNIQTQLYIFAWYCYVNILKKPVQLIEHLLAKTFYSGEHISGIVSHFTEFCLKLNEFYVLPSEILLVIVSHENIDYIYSNSWVKFYSL
jgi:hypothetical protein